MIIIAIAVIILICFLIVKLSIFVSYNKDEGLRVNLKIFIFKMTIFPSKNPLKHEKRLKSLRKTLDHLKSDQKKQGFGFVDGIELFFELLKQTKQAITVTQLEISIKIGLDDAAQTAVAVGSLYATIYGSLGALQNCIFIKKPQIEIIPCYNEFLASGTFKFNFQTRVINLIIIGIMLMKKIKL